MSDTIITVERLSKKYRLGQIGATTMRESVERWLAGLRRAGRDHRPKTIDHRPEGERGLATTKHTKDAKGGAGGACETIDHRHETIDHRPKQGCPEQETSESTDGQITESSPSSGLKSNVYSLRSDPQDPQDPSDLWALRDVSFEVKRGVWGIAGLRDPSDSLPTTLRVVMQVGFAVRRINCEIARFGDFIKGLGIIGRNGAGN